MFSRKNIFTYNRYASICANTVRKCLKKDKRIEAEKRENVFLKVSNWINGKQGESKTLLTGKYKKKQIAENKLIEHKMNVNKREKAY
ncbi:hypothetical protein PORY_001342 [Pneumocystis oryctolagi]|uniref:Uncharacterized protein n=1 Tax=Pneumocystis oryctolagi TaxID=42067 RepID=A0ACB7CFA0_9ASCO|nr:hypothetical protein PORY_001342 [Pneumocystis oryctolagi]